VVPIIHADYRKYIRFFIVPCDVKVGWNWGDAGESNPLGLAKYKGHDKRVAPGEFLNGNRVY
jgi:hypothetical protein